MKKLTTIIGITLSLLIGSSLYGQSFQHSEQKGTSNYISSSLISAEGGFIGSEIIVAENFTTNSELFARDQDNALLWNVQSTILGEVVAYSSLISLTDSTFGTLGYHQDCCDCTEPIPFFEVRRKDNGSLLQFADQVLSSEIINTPFFNSALTVSTNTWGFSILNETQAYYFSNEGDSLHSFELGEGFGAVSDLNGDFIVSSAAVIRRYNSEGIKVDSVEVSGLPSALSSNEERLAALIDDEIFVFDSNLELVQSIQIDGISESLMSESDSGFTLFTGEDIVVVSNQGELLNQYEYGNTQGFEATRMVANFDAIILTGSKVSDSFTINNIRHQYAAYRVTTIEGASQLWHSDLEIVDVFVENAVVTSSNEFSLSYSADLLVTVRNIGTFPVNSFYLNYVSGPGFCNPQIENMQVIETINNQENPGSEISILFPSVQGSFYIPIDGPDFTLCVFVTQPDFDIDIDRDNDSGCADLADFLSVDDLDVSSRVSIYPNPATAEIRIETDLLLESYQIFSGLGKMLQEGIANQGSLIALDDLPNGIYVVKLTTAEGVATKKVVVSR
jgi:hypothetical protein